MRERPDSGGFGSLWGKLFGFALVISAAFYATQHPHTFGAYLAKLFLAP